ncbi:MAG TPA: FAD:protein FMN transferase [Marinagarivorans sp.]
MDFYRVPFKAMGTACQIRILAGSQQQAETLAQPAIAQITLLEQRYSRYLPDSLVSQINSNAGLRATPLDTEAKSLFAYAASAYEQSDGLFDITSGVLRRAWNFRKVAPADALNKPQAPELPTNDMLNKLLACSGWPAVGWRGENSITLPSGFEIDFGGFVKEYAADSALSRLTAAGVAAAMVDLGGDIAVHGADWPIAIKNPRQPNTKLAHIKLQSGGLATSGNYERFFMLEGRRYSHILNPKTGWPVVTPASISVVADSCLVAGTVSTVAMLAGEDRCLEYLEAFELPFCCVFNDGRVINRF